MCLGFGSLISEGKIKKKKKLLFFQFFWFSIILCSFDALMCVLWSFLCESVFFMFLASFWLSFHRNRSSISSSFAFFTWLLFGRNPANLGFSGQLLGPADLG